MDEENKPERRVPFIDKLLEVLVPVSGGLTSLVIVGQGLEAYQNGMEITGRAIMLFGGLVALGGAAIGKYLHNCNNTIQK